MSRGIKASRGMRMIGFCFALVGFTVHGGISSAEEGRMPIGVSVQKNIRVVYQIKDDDWKGGIGRGLYYLQKLVGTYDSLAIAEGDRSIHAVFHDSAGYWMLTDKSYDRFKGSKAGNPNKHVIEELVKRGVSIELCAQTMKSQGWNVEDILPDVKIVVGAYPRIIDLQMQGYAYIRF
ncbi:MAG: DsrE family protein [Rugosibacter sp.]|nr:DsrE family protein [Rugosibacter sp.]